MASAKMGINSGYGSLGRTKGILIETMQLVEPRKSVPVPNHLLESKVYSKLAQNSVVQARPAVLHFGGFEIGKVHKHELELANVSTEVQRMHIIPPQTKYFAIKYTKQERLVPGLTLSCTVEFTPDEWRYYYDCIRIHTKDESENIVIPIHAYPVMSTDDFPSHIDFPLVPVGQRKTRMIPLRCSVPIDFEYQLVYLQPHPAFVVHPMSGVIPANGEVDVEVTFSPSEFSSAHMKLQLMISQFNAKPLICTVTGSSAPGLAKEMTEAAYEMSDLDPRSITPIGRYRDRKKLRASAEGRSIEPKPQEIEVNGVRFPANLDTPFAVAQVLNQEAGKLRIKDIREAVSAKKGDSVKSTRQMKEAVFEMAVRQDVYEERQNQLRWQVRVGEKPISPPTRRDIEDKRERAWNEYKTNRGDPVLEDEYNRSCTNCTLKRTTRDITQLGEEGVKFDTYSNDMWAVRHSALGKLQQAARKIIIRRRADKKVKALRDLVTCLNSQSTMSMKSVMSSRRDHIDAEDEEFEVAPTRITSVNFPTYSAPNVKDDMAVDALGNVPFKPTEVIVQKKTPYFELKVPQQYSLMGYKPHHVHEAASGYVPKNLVRPLRSGAEDEMIILPPPLRAPDSEDTPVNEGDMALEDISSQPATPAPAPYKPLQPPPELFEPIKYPPLHIFNPAPGLQVFQPPLPYSETDSDFHLCPLPRYVSQDTANPHMSTQRRYLDREDVIRGVMVWKKFPSQGLTSLSNTPTITNVWVPRWNDPFSKDALPMEVPAQVEGLSQTDKDNIQQEEEEEGGEIMLTPDMVNAQFNLIDSSSPTDDKSRKDDFPNGNKMPSTNVPVSESGPVPREKREAELEFFLKKKYNRLGNRFHSRVQNVNQLKTNPDLILK